MTLLRDAIGKVDEDGTLHMGTRTARCPHCGEGPTSTTTYTASGRQIIAWYLGDTCCKTRATEIMGFNRKYAAKYRETGRKWELEEAEELDARNREIAKTIRQKGL